MFGEGKRGTEPPKPLEDKKDDKSASERLDGYDQVHVECTTFHRSYTIYDPYYIICTTFLNMESIKIKGPMGRTTFCIEPMR